MTELEAIDLAHEVGPFSNLGFAMTYCDLPQNETPLTMPDRWVVGFEDGFHQRRTIRNRAEWEALKQTPVFIENTASGVVHRVHNGEFFGYIRSDGQRTYCGVLIRQPESQQWHWQWHETIAKPLTCRNCMRVERQLNGQPAT